MADLERQHIASATEQYGALEPSLKKDTNDTTEKLPLLLGRWAVAPEQLYNYALTAYVVWFLIHRLADIAYICTVDARFPEGLGHLYPSEAQRLESVSYTRQVLLCGMIHRCVVFVAVFCLVYFQGFAKFDAALRAFFGGVAAWWESSRLNGCFGCCAPIGRVLSFCWAPFGRCLGACGGNYCVSLKDRVINGRLGTEINNRFGFAYSWRELLLGAVFLSLLSALFFALSGPFMYWNQMLDLKFGFANSLSVTLTNFKANFVAALISSCISGIPQKFLFLCVLQYKFGWVFMWAGLFVGIIYAQYNVAMIAPMLGMNTKFPTSVFGVGRGFPMQETANRNAPWISLNRLYFPDTFSQAVGGGDPKVFYTSDKSKGQVALAKSPTGKWTMSGTAWFDPSATIYAETTGTADKLVGGLNELSWNLGGENTRMGVRSGEELRSKLFGFAQERRLGIGEVYMVDGSHKDARANAFVTGAGNHSIIGLYDTLFLGQRGADAPDEAIPEEDIEGELVEGKSLVQRASEIVQGVDVEGEDRDKRAPRNAATTQAMNDDEIVAILAHELAHAGLHHMEMGMGAQVFTSFVTFATLGWMAHSPLAGAALSLTAPLIHVGSAAYDHVVGPPLEGFMKLFTDALTRHNEYEADAYAAKISEKYGTGLQTALAKLSVNSNQDPDPPFFFEAMHADHPPFAKRWAHIEMIKKQTYGDETKSMLKK